MSAPLLWRCRDRVLDLGERTLVMGILNVTPDSFSDGGRYAEPDDAVAHARAMLAQGADVIDLGGESTRPGSPPVPPEEQIRRLEPVLERLRREEPEAVLSVDTQSAQVARHALARGVRIVNDVSALRDADMAAVVAEAGAGVVLMHMRGNPETMQRDTVYADVVEEVASFLEARRAIAHAAGIADDAIALDPGIGFGKSVEGSVALLAGTARLAALGRPLVLGTSRKSVLGKLTGDASVGDRLSAGLAAAAIAVFAGARVLRVHDVAETRRAVRVADAIRAARETH